MFDVKSETFRQASTLMEHPVKYAMGHLLLVKNPYAAPYRGVISRAP